MSEINLKSPHFKQRDVDTVKLVAQVSLGTACSASVDAIDLAGLTVASCAATFTISGFEAEADVALDSTRRAGLSFLGMGTATGLSAAEVADLNVTSAVISGTAGSRIVTVTLAAGAGAVAFSTDSLSDAVIELALPIKAKDFD